jgi:hypothetical protein
MMAKLIEARVVDNKTHNAKRCENPRCCGTMRGQTPKARLCWVCETAEKQTCKQPLPMIDDVVPATYDYGREIVTRISGTMQ